MILIIIVASHATAAATANSYAGMQENDDSIIDNRLTPSPSLEVTDLQLPTNMIHAPFGPYDPLLESSYTHSPIDNVEFDGLNRLQRT